MARQLLIILMDLVADPDKNFYLTAIYSNCQNIVPFTPKRGTYSEHI